MNRPATTALIAAALILTPTTAHATPGHDPVTICHKPGTPAEHEITIDRDALDKHLEHGDVVGACEVVTIPTPIDPEPTPEPTDPPVIVEPTPTPEPTEEPTWEPTAPPTVEPSPEPVNPEPKPNDEPTPVAPTAPTTPDSETSTPGSPEETRSSATTETPSASQIKPSATPHTTTQPTTRPELAETGFNRGLIALAASMVAAGAAIILGSRWRRE